MTEAACVSTNRADFPRVQQRPLKTLRNPNTNGAKIHLSFRRGPADSYRPYYQRPNAAAGCAAAGAAGAVGAAGVGAVGAVGADADGVAAAGAAVAAGSRVLAAEKCVKSKSGV